MDQNNRKIIKIEIPREIWDAHISIFNFRDIFGAWAKSIMSVVNQMSNENENENE